MSHELIVEALNIYMFFWLHGTSKDYDHRSVLKIENFHAYNVTLNAYDVMQNVTG